jgi:hemerythrin-like metal-binding protein
MEVIMSLTDTEARHSITDWNARYAIGIPSVDSHYYHLFFLFNTNNDDFIDYASTNDLHTVFDQLVDYARYQFFAEELWMQHHLFPHLLSHKKEHGHMLTKASDIRKELRGGVWSLSLDILEAMHHWLQTHILMSDEEINEFITSQQFRNAHHSDEHKEKTFETARTALLAWHAFYRQTAFKVAAPAECVETKSCVNGGLSC